MTKTIKFDSQGRVLPNALPDVKIGNERIKGSSALAGPGFVVCQEHGTTKACWVRGTKPIMLYSSCYKCVKAYCTIGHAVVRPNYLADGSPITSDEGNPNGHSY